MHRHFGCVQKKITDECFGARDLAISGKTAINGKQQVDGVVHHQNTLACIWSSPSLCTQYHVQCALLAPSQNHSRPRGAVTSITVLQEQSSSRINEHGKLFGESVVGTADGVRNCTRDDGVSMLDKRVVDKLKEASIDMS